MAAPRKADAQMGSRHGDGDNSDSDISDSDIFDASDASDSGQDYAGGGSRGIDGGGDEETLLSADMRAPGAISKHAERYNQAEHDLTLRQAVAAYPRAIFWCLVASACVIMEGYDTILIGNFYAYPAFAEKYGQFVDAAGQHQLSAEWQAVLGNSSGAGCFVGVWLNGLLVDRFGQKRVLLGALAALSATVFLTFFAPNIHLLVLGELLCGLPWGIFATSAPAYASEVLPLCLRVYLTSYTNMCFILGQLAAAAVLAVLVHRTDEWAYRIPFALQWVWPAIIAPLLLFAPESPWFLVRRGRIEEARASLRRLRGWGDGRAAPATMTENGASVEATLAYIIETNELEERLTPGTSYWDCFRGVERRRSEIACLAFAGQVLSGSAFAYNSTYFFQQVGLSAGQTYLLNTGGTALALLGTLVNWFALTPYYGRRRIYLCGTLAMAGLLALIGVLTVWNDGGSGSSGSSGAAAIIGLAQAVLTLAWTFVFQLSVGQLGWAIPAEVGSTRLRQKTVCLARNTYYVAIIAANALQPFLMNPAQLHLRGYAGFVWSASAFATFVWAYFRLPETGGRTYEELDWLFSQHTPTRDFERARVRSQGVHRQAAYEGDQEDDGDEDGYDDGDGGTEMARLMTRQG